MNKMKKNKKPKKRTPAEKYEHFLKKTVVQNQMVKVSYSQEQGLGVFLEKLEARGQLDLFTNTKIGCSIPELAEFYANDLNELLGVSTEGFDVYVREDKSVLDDERLLELIQRLA